MGIWPLTFCEPDSVDTLRLIDVVDITVESLPAVYMPRMSVKASAIMKDGSAKKFDAGVKVATRSELRIHLAGGLLPETLTTVLAACG